MSSNSLSVLRGYNKELLEGGACFKKALIDEKKEWKGKVGIAHPERPYYILCLRDKCKDFWVLIAN